MSHLRLVQPDERPHEEPLPDDRPRVSLRLLMAMAGRCACDDCLLSYRAGNKHAGIIDVSAILDRDRSVGSLHGVR